MTDVEKLLVAAAEAAPRLADATPGQRRELLARIADALDAADDELVPIARRETHLPEARLRGELARTTFQLRLLGAEIASGRPLDLVLDSADPAWPAGGRPDLRHTLVPVGPVVVFAAGNFPFAFSVAGGDTAAALAAGCPVVLKAHPGHPELSVRTAEIVVDALRVDGAFGLVHTEDEGRAVLLDDRIAAGSFTGSTAGGRALADLAAGRSRPIPFHAEMGSVNPVFVTPAAAGRAAAIAEGWVGSALLGAGQFCTKPGLLLVPTDVADDVLAVARRERPAAPLLGARRAAAREALVRHPDVRVVLDGGADPAAPTFLATTAAALLADTAVLAAECFGPTAMVVTYRDADELRALARSFAGELTATVHGEADEPLAAELIGLAARFAGRVVWNGWPTGVAVTHAMHHGGPYPAALGGHTSVGTGAIRRFLRPVAFQDVPDALLPPALRAADPLRLARRVS